MTAAAPEIAAREDEPVATDLLLEEARDAFADQIEGLVAGGPGVGVDLLAIETMMAINESEQAIYAAKQVAPEIPVLAMVTVDEDANCLDGTPADVAAARLTAAGADAIGCNCSTGPATVLTAIERMRAATDVPLVAMPNAGMPRNVDTSPSASLSLVVPRRLARSPKTSKSRRSISSRSAR